MSREEVELEIVNEHGLHARPAALFVQTAARFQSAVTLQNLGKTPARDVNAKSIMDVLTAGINRGTRVRITAEGEDASQAIAALQTLVEGGLGDA